LGPALSLASVPRALFASLFWSIGRLTCSSKFLRAAFRHSPPLALLIVVQAASSLWGLDLDEASSRRAGVCRG
jgi:hypothetical protein